jgi:hypothetical protein
MGRSKPEVRARSRKARFALKSRHRQIRLGKSVLCRDIAWLIDRLVGTASWRHIELKGLGGFAKRIQACLGNSFGAFAFIKQADRLEGDGPILMPLEGSGWRELRIAAPASPRQLNKWRGANVVVHEPLEEAQTRTVSHHQEFR